MKLRLNNVDKLFLISISLHISLGLIAHQIEREFMWVSISITLLMFSCSAFMTLVFYCRFLGEKPSPLGEDFSLIN
jgi:drug/metabolite transporter (DMT)-like permease